FIKNVLARRNYASEQAIQTDLTRHMQRINHYATVNDSDTAYGFYRLDAFGRIYNRVLEHLLNGTALIGVLKQMAADGWITDAQIQRVCACSHAELANAMSDEDRDALVAR